MRVDIEDSNALKGYELLAPVPYLVQIPIKVQRHEHPEVVVHYVQGSFMALTEITHLQFVHHFIMMMRNTVDYPVLNRGCYFGAGS